MFFWNFLFIKESWKKKYPSLHTDTQEMILEQISEGSCDTEDWSNNVENSVFAITRINYILKHIKQKKLFKIVILSLFLLYDLWSNTFLKYVNKKKLSYWPHTFERQCTIPLLTIFLLIYSWRF